MKRPGPEEFRRALERLGRSAGDAAKAFRLLGAGSVFLARGGMHPGWAMRREMRSRRYTTRWEELPVVLA